MSRLPHLLAVVVSALLVASTATSCSSVEPPDRTDPSDADARCTSSVDPAAPGVMRSGGQDRRYLLAVPDERPSPTGFPLIVSLHGHGGSAAKHEASTSLAARASEAGYVTVTPEGLGGPRRWNWDRRPDGPDDYAFLAELIDDLVDHACVDPQRVFLAGSSNGAAFAGFAACTDLSTGPGVAAVAMVIATVPPTCPPAVAPPVLTIRGTADVTVPYDHDGVAGMVAAWADHDRCADPAQVDEAHPGVIRTTYAKCADDGAVVLAVVEGGVHAWPGSTSADRQGNSPAGVGWSATDEVLAFFSAVDPGPAA